MRIQGPGNAASATTASAARRSASGTFSLETESPVRTGAMPTGVRNIGGIDALLALQGIEEPRERPTKAARRGAPGARCPRRPETRPFVGDARYRRAGAAHIGRCGPG